MSPPAPRLLYGVLSARSLSYARICTASLFRNALEPLSMTLITDGPDDKAALVGMMEEIAPDARHSWRVVDKGEADARAEDVFAKYPNLRRFRNGHPCWRKVTDPPLFARVGEEMVILDPDVYFPNPFRFEPTPPLGVLLMRQDKNCLFPHELVRHAFDRGVAMADVTDIGVCQALCPLDYEWLDDLIARLGGADLPAWSPHVESIVWAALAMRVGGGYLDPGAWFCFNDPISKRLRVRLLKVDPMDILRAEPIRGAKCFHAGGKAKKWLVDAEQAGLLRGSGPREQPCPILPFKPYTRAQFDRKQLALKIARSLGVMSVVGGHD
jgi:hypothetical protein